MTRGLPHDDTHYGSEGWGFESLRLRPAQRPIPIMEWAFLLACTAAKYSYAAPSLWSSPCPRGTARHALKLVVVREIKVPGDGEGAILLIFQHFCKDDIPRISTKDSLD
jgi:hypothetical protein